VRHTRVVEVVVTKLLIAAVAETSQRVRKSVVRAMYNSLALDSFLAQVTQLPGEASGVMHVKYNCLLLAQGWVLCVGCRVLACL
jgi:hypothetical protein